MNTLPRSRGPLVLRTDFSDQAAWDALQRATLPNEDGFAPNVEFLDDRAHAGLTVDQALALVSRGYGHQLLVLADEFALSSADLPVLVLDLSDEQGRRGIRVIGTRLWSIENNLSLSNMDFHEFADSVDDDGVFRGF